MPRAVLQGLLGCCWQNGTVGVTAGQPCPFPAPLRHPEPRHGAGATRAGWWERHGWHCLPLPLAPQKSPVQVLRKLNPAGNWCKSGLSRGSWLLKESYPVEEGELGWQREVRDGLRRDLLLPYEQAQERNPQQGRM